MCYCLPRGFLYHQVAFYEQMCRRLNKMSGLFYNEQNHSQVKHTRGDQKYVSVAVLKKLSIVYCIVLNKP